jgi:hypothetical protein
MVILFQEMLVLHRPIINSYSKQTNVRMFGRVPPPITWFIC